MWPLVVAPADVEPHAIGIDVSDRMVECLDVEIPDDKILVPGVIDTTTHFVEHPELIAQRIERFAGIVGRERVMAGTDCGFSTFAGYAGIDPEIAYAKLASLAEGAQLASDRLW